MDEEWTCRQCTFINRGNMLNCYACYTSKPRREPGLPNVTNPEPMGYYQTQQHKGASYGWSTHLCQANELRIILLGRTGSGKSATGNNILGEKVFETSAGGASVTKRCQRGRGSRFNRDIQIIDSPGLFDTGMTNADITKEVVKCIGMTAPGPHAFVLVVRIDRFIAEARDTVRHYIELFGDDMLNYLIVLFTRKDDLHHVQISLEEYLKKGPQELQLLLKSCNNRYIAFNNSGSDEEKNKDVQDFLTLVDRVFLDNEGKCYTSEMYVKVEKNMKIREEQLRQKHEQKIEEERNAIRRDFELKLQMKYDEDVDMRRQLEERIETLEREKAEKAESKAKSEMVALLREMEQQKLAVNRAMEEKMNRAMEEKKESDKQLALESRRREQEAIKRHEAEKPDFREETRKELNDDSSAIITTLETVVPVVINGLLPHIIPAAVNYIKKRLS